MKSWTATSFATPVSLAAAMQKSTMMSLMPGYNNTWISVEMSISLKDGSMLSEERYPGWEVSLSSLLGLPPCFAYMFIALYNWLTTFLIVQPPKQVPASKHLFQEACKLSSVLPAIQYTLMELATGKTPSTSSFHFGRLLMCSFNTVPQQH